MQTQATMVLFCIQVQSLARLHEAHKICILFVAFLMCALCTMNLCAPAEGVADVPNLESCESLHHACVGVVYTGARLLLQLNLVSRHKFSADFSNFAIIVILSRGMKKRFAQHWNVKDYNKYVCTLLPLPVMRTVSVESILWWRASTLRFAVCDECAVPKGVGRRYIRFYIYLVRI